jgi:hypothetical protein
MKKVSLFTTWCIALANSTVALVWGISIGNESNKEQYEFSEFKMELIEAQGEALKAANVVIYKNGLFDTDGSDEMSEYMDLYWIVDSLLYTQL